MLILLLLLVARMGCILSRLTTNYNKFVLIWIFRSLDGNLSLKEMWVVTYLYIYPQVILAKRSSSYTVKLTMVRFVRRRESLLGINVNRGIGMDCSGVVYGLPSFNFSTVRSRFTPSKPPAIMM